MRGVQNTIDHSVLASGLCPSSTDVTSAVYWVIYVRAFWAALSVHLHVENIPVKSTQSLMSSCFQKPISVEDTPGDLMSDYV